VSLQASSWAWQWGASGAVTRTRLLALLFLADHADSNGVCWPTVDHIARHIGVTQGTLYRALRELESSGLVRREGRRFFLQLEKLP
jgi:DNA-binding transcriptional ArsR family regulator